MLIRLSELRALVNEVLTESKKNKGGWVPPWLNKDKEDKKVKNEAKDEGVDKPEKKEAKPEKKEAPAASAKKEKSASVSGKAMPAGHELNKTKGKASSGDAKAAGKKEEPAEKKAKAAPPVAKGKKAGAVGDVAPKFKGKPPERAEFGGGDDELPPDIDAVAGLGDDAELDTPQSLDDVPTNVVGLRVWLRDFVAPRVPESQISAFHRLITAFVSQAEERTLAQKEPEMRKRLGINGKPSVAGGGGKVAKPSKLGQPSPKIGGQAKPVATAASGLTEKKK